MGADRLEIGGELPGLIVRGANCPDTKFEPGTQWRRASVAILRDLAVVILACEQAHLIGKGGGAAIASRRSRREEWGEEK